MGNKQRFEELEVWRKSRRLVDAIYQVSEQGRFARDFGLRDQIRRAAVSVPSNIAEGYERNGDREMLQFLSHAKGSCGEVRCQLYLASDRAYLEREAFEALVADCQEISRMLAGFMRYIRESRLQGSKKKDR